MLSFHEIMKLHCSPSILVKPKLVNTKLPKNKTGYHRSFKKDQMNMFWSYKKINFYSTFNTNVSRSEYLDLIKNETHRQAVHNEQNYD